MYAYISIHSYMHISMLWLPATLYQHFCAPTLCTMSINIFMYKNVYICIYIHMYVYVYICIYIYVYIRLHVYVYMCVYIYHLPARRVSFAKEPLPQGSFARDTRPYGDNTP